MDKRGKMSVKEREEEREDLFVREKRDLIFFFFSVRWRRGVVLQGGQCGKVKMW